jgi:hypothetical protein
MLTRTDNPMDNLRPAVTKKTKMIIRKCHCCSKLTESAAEVEKCLSCGKSFLPLNYFAKIHGNDEYKFDELWAKGHELEEEDLIKGLFVIW